MLTIADHLSHVDAIFASYETRSGDEPLAFVSDLMADAVLWCMANGIDFRDALRRGQANAACEWKEAAAGSESMLSRPETQMSGVASES